MDFSSSDSRSSSPNHEYISEEQSDYVNSSDEHESPVFDPFYSSDEQELPRKRMKLSNVDRITDLPDALITHILSLLPVDAAVRTQLLSKRWRYTWASSQNCAYGENAEDKRYELLEISDPSIRSLEISDYMGWQDFRLRDVSSLVQVTFRFRAILNQRSSYSSSAVEMMHLLIRKISHVEKLSLGTWCTQVLSRCELGSEPTIPLQCKVLEIDSIYEKSLPGIARLLRSSLCLERLTFYMNPYTNDQTVDSSVLFYFIGKNYWKSTERATFKNLWQNLKIVQLIGLSDEMEWVYMVELAEYLLNHAKVLEVLLLNPGEGAYGQCRRSDLRDFSLFQVMKKLLNCPRGSRHARVSLL